MKKVKKIIVSGILSFLFTNLLSFLGKSNILNWLQNKDIIGKNVKIDLIKDIFTVFSIFLTFILLTIPMILSQINEHLYHRQRDDLLYHWKEVFIISLSEKLAIKNLSMDIRIFVPIVTIKSILTKWIFRKNIK